MIVPMKKAAILAQSKDSEQTIQKLRALGAVHVEHQNAPKGKDTGLLLEDIALLEATLAVLAQPDLGTMPLQTEKTPLDWRFTVRHLLGLRNRLNQLKDYSFRLQGKISQWERWGDFNPQDIQALREKGVYIRLYQIPFKEIKKMPVGVIVKKIYAAGGVDHCVLISRQDVEIPFKEVALPKMGLGALRARFSDNNRAIKLIREDIRKIVPYRKALSSIKDSLEEELEFHNVLNGMGRCGEVVYLKGYIPFDAVELLRQSAKVEQWGISISEPGPKDRVPTLIRNPRWVSVIKPVFKLIEIIPGYKELDISLWFLIFFSIFFGMLVGDAGLGLSFLALTFLANRKWGPGLRDKSIFTLLYISSFCTVIWGVLTGTFFGQEWLPQWISPLLPALRNDRNIQTLCFLLGAVHLSIAHGWRALVKLPSAAALAEAGWICILWGAFFLAKVLVLGYAFPVIAKWLFIVGGSLVLLFTNPSKNIFRSIGSGLGSLLLNLVNSFTDVVSYIRLFAVGLATVAIADAFNKMAMEIGFSNIFTGMLTALILLVGLLLNLILAPLSVLVHGVRLNVLEFCNHADVKWSGFAYNPFKKKVKG
ncbi:MAG: hypothetical protein JW869_06670 [Candidatus Omnitrophica bacterium]|nr:hypothetical protein [Candidatus Omnitrophota bacterium]